MLVVSDCRYIEFYHLERIASQFYDVDGWEGVFIA